MEDSLIEEERVSMNIPRQKAYNAITAKNMGIMHPTARVHKRTEEID